MAEVRIGGREGVCCATVTRRAGERTSEGAGGIANRGRSEQVLAGSSCSQFSCVKVKNSVAAPAVFTTFNLRSVEEVASLRGSVLMI